METTNFCIPNYSQVLAYIEYVEESDEEMKDNQSWGEIEANSRVNPGISSCAKYNNF